MSKNTGGNQKGTNPNFLKNPAAGGGDRDPCSQNPPAVGNDSAGGQKHAAFVSAIVSIIMSSAKEHKIHVVYKKVVDFANTYSTENPPVRKEKGKLFEQANVDRALAVFQENYKQEQEQQPQARAKPPKNPNNLFGQFLWKARAQNFCDKKDIISFAQWYTSQKHILPIAENPSPTDVQEMLLFLRREIAKQDDRPELLMSGWELYNELCGSVNASIPFDAHQGASKRISNALGDELPSGGKQVVPNAFIFRVSEGWNISTMKNFLQYSHEIKAMPSFLYDCGGNPIFDKNGIQDLPEGQICIVFLESIGRMKKASSGVCFVRTSGPELHTQNDEFVEKGFARAISVEDDSEQNVEFCKANMQMLPHLLQTPLQYWVEFMEKNGAFPLRVSFSKKVEVEEEC